MSSPALSKVRISSPRLILLASVVPAAFVCSHPWDKMVTDLLVFALLLVVSYLEVRRRTKYLQLELFEDRVVGPVPGIWSNIRRRRREILITEIKKDALPGLPNQSISNTREPRIVANDGSEILICVGILNLEQLKSFLFALRTRVEAV